MKRNKSAATPNTAERLEWTFGFKPTVSAEDKQTRVDGVFRSVARRYDLMNDLMSGGLHRLWKDALVTKARPPRRGDWRCLDMAGGTGDVAFRLFERSRGNAVVTVGDINDSMLEVGEARAAGKGFGENIRFVTANAEVLPFEDASFDCYTISLGLRNVPKIKAALAEAHRVLKPGGHFLCLEFSQIAVPAFERLYERWSFEGIPRIGRIVTGDADSYRYLVESIRKFPDQDTFANTIRSAGFKHVTFTNLTFGVVAIHSAWKV